MNNNINNTILSLIKKIKPEQVLKIGFTNMKKEDELLTCCNELNINLSIATEIPEFELLKIASENKNLSVINGILIDELNNLDKFDIIIIDNITNKTETLKPLLNRIESITANTPIILVEILTKDIYNDVYKIKKINEIIEEYVNTSKNNLNYHNIYNYDILSIIYAKNIKIYKIIEDIDTYNIKNNPFYMEYREILEKNRKLTEKTEKLEERMKILSKQTVEQYNQINN